MDEWWNALEKYNLWSGDPYKWGLVRTAYTGRIQAFWQFVDLK